MRQHTRILLNTTALFLAVEALAGCTVGGSEDADEDIATLSATIAWPRAAKNLDSQGNEVNFIYNYPDAGIRIVKTAPDGTELLNLNLPDGCADDIAVDPSDNILLTCELVGASTPLDFGGGPLPADPVSTGNSGFVFVKLAPDGTHVWSHRYYNEITDTWGYYVTSDVKGNVLIVGSFEDANWDTCQTSGTMTFMMGAKKVSVPIIDDGTCDANHTMFVAGFTPAGATSWVKLFSGYSNYPMEDSIAVSSSGNIIVTGALDTGVVAGKTTNFGGKYLPADATRFTLTLSSTGGTRSVEPY